MHLLMLVVVGAVINEASSGVECPPGTVKMGGGLCEPIERRSADDSNCPPGTAKTEDGLKCTVITGRRAADDSNCPPGTAKTEDGLKCTVITGRRAADDSNCPPGTAKTEDGLKCTVITGRRAADDSNCPPGTAKTEDGLKCTVTGRRAADASLKDNSDEPYCPKGKFYLKGDCVGRGRRTADVTDNCPPGRVMTIFGQCIPQLRRAADASFKDMSDEPYCPKGKFYLKGDCIGRGRRTADVSKSKDGYVSPDEHLCPSGSFYHDGQCVPIFKRSLDEGSRRMRT